MAQVGEAHSIELIQTKIHSIWIISAVYYNLSVSLLCVCVCVWRSLMFGLVGWCIANVQPTK